MLMRNQVFILGDSVGESVESNSNRRFGTFGVVSLELAS
jgi:hypothetical protein